MIFAIDPGSEKTGTAVVNDDGSLVTKAIVPTPQLGDYLSRIYAAHPFTQVVMGDGTNHKKLQPLVEDWIAAHHPELTFALTDEKFTTVEGRKLYFKYTPRRGWRRFVPLSLQYPPEPVDDFVAWIIGRRYLAKQRGEKA
ncbi:hypothetical protein [Megasphaera sp.]|uniref:hypothetical protein n=1 Tax=Megasphaera sp. TaxID=2023260 RepID=UPI0025EB9ED5|nr:hypothetical protein [uncultured Megasphaera sp.]